MYQLFLQIYESVGVASQVPLTRSGKRHIGRVDQVSETISKEPRVSDAWITLLDEATDTHTTVLKAIVCIYFKVRMYGYTNKKMEQF